jgi:hypothetical protein
MELGGQLDAPENNPGTRWIRGSFHAGNLFKETTHLHGNVKFLLPRTYIILIADARRGFLHDRCQTLSKHTPEILTFLKQITARYSI